MPCDGRFCSGCGQSGVGERYVPPDGLGTSGILVLAESPWVEEVRKGRPLVGPSGYLFDRLLRRSGISRDSLTITNTMNCRPPFLGWFDQRKGEAAVALDRCRSYLDAIIEQRHPKVIVTLGGVALQSLTGAAEMSNAHGYVFDTRYGIPAIGTYHPAFVLRGNHKLFGACSFVFKRAVEIAAAGRFERQPTAYLLDPPLPTLEDYLGRWTPDSPLSFDIETPYSAKVSEDETDGDISFEIVRASLSIEEGTGASFPWAEPYVSLVKGLLEAARLVVGWNIAGFDAPRLAAAGTPIKGEVCDAMWAWHFLQSDLPKSLGFVAPFYSDVSAWKHLSDSQPAYYSAVDADVTLRCYLGIKRDLEAQQRWGAFERHCTRTLPVLAAMGGRGLAVDRERQQAFKGRLERELVEAKATLQRLVPAEVKPLKVYKGVPGAARAHCKANGLDIKALTALEFEVEGAAYSFNDGRWQRRDPFNPDSPLQTKALIKHLALPMPKNRKTGEDSTGAIYLGRFAKKHEVFRWILECRQRADMLGTFIWPVNAAGRVTTQYGFHPSTHRKSSRNVNLQNIPKRSDLANEFRQMLVASPGHLLIEADSAAIEAVLVGYFAHDPDYMRLAKLGVHDFLTSHMVHEPAQVGWDDGRLRAHLQGVKKAHKEVREAAKRCIHGSNYGLTPHGMHDQYAEYFPTERVAREMQEFYFSLFPKVRQWHRSVLQQAHGDGYLQNPFGYRHYFYNALTYSTDNGGWVFGDDAKRAIAFLPQSTASALQTEYLLKLAADDEVAPHLRLIIHDSIVLEVPIVALDIVAQRVYDVMTMPLPQLGGLAIGAEVQVGDSLGNMQVWEGAQVRGEGAPYVGVGGHPCVGPDVQEARGSYIAL